MALNCNSENTWKTPAHLWFRVEDGKWGRGGANHKSISVKTEQISAQLALKEQLMKYT